MATLTEVHEKLSKVAEGQINVLSGLLGRAEGLAERLAGPKHRPSGFASLGEFLGAVQKQVLHLGRDTRLDALNAVTTYSSEAAGDFPTPGDHRQEVTEAVVGTGSIVSAIKPLFTTASILRLPVDVVPDWSSSGFGVEVLATGAAATPSKAALRLLEIPLYRISSLTHVGDELLGRVPPVADYVAGGQGRKLAARVEQFIFNGTGENEPLGILNAPSKVTVTPTASTASAIAGMDVQAMVAKLPPGSYSRALWACHPTVLPALAGLAPALYSASGAGPAGALCGKPLYTSEYLSAVGASGDLVLLDPAGYALAFDGVHQAMTIGFGFDQGLQSVRSTLYMGGAPVLPAAVARKTGNDLLSHVIVLGTRS